MTRSVSVIVPAYEAERFVREAVTSALAQTLPPAEVIVVDDGSSDGTSAAVEAIGAERVRVIRQPNAGVSAARNTGAAEATGELLAFLDADDVWEPSKLEKQVERLDHVPGAGLVHCGYREIDLSGREGDVHVDGLEGTVTEEMLLLRRPAVLVAGSSAVVPAETFRDAGGFDEALSTSADWDLVFRIARRRPVAFVPEPLVRYRRYGESMSHNPATMRRDMLRAFEKAFADGDAATARLRRRAYGRLHLILGASFLDVGRRADAARHLGRALVLDPALLPEAATKGVRKLRRRARD